MLQFTFPVFITDMSSAESAILLSFRKVWGKLLMYTRHKKGQRTDPWETPLTLSAMSLRFPFTNTYCDLLQR